MPERLPDEELLDEIRRLGEMVDGTPSTNDMKEQGRHHPSTYYDRFGSWKEAVRLAGFEPHQSGTKIPTEKLISDIQRVADEIGHPPTINEYTEHGNHSIPTYTSRFGTWPAVIEEAGFEPGNPSPIPRDWLLGDLRSLIDRSDGHPTIEEINTLGKYSAQTYRNRFGSKAAAIEAAEAFTSPGAGDSGRTTTDEANGRTPFSLSSRIDELAFDKDEVDALIDNAIEELRASQEAYHCSDLEVFDLYLSTSVKPGIPPDDLETEEHE